jgi:hypothetical protein
MVAGFPAALSEVDTRPAAQAGTAAATLSRESKQKERVRGSRAGIGYPPECPEHITKDWLEIAWKIA